MDLGEETIAMIHLLLADERLPSEGGVIGMTPAKAAHGLIPLSSLHRPQAQGLAQQAVGNVCTVSLENTIISPDELYT
jgi:hypothetical protein